VAARALRRILQGAITLALSGLLLFVLMRLAPGDPLARLEGDTQLSAAETLQLRQRFGLDQPIASQLAAYASGLARGDLGVSIGHYPERVSSLIASRLPATLLLGGAVLLLNFTVGIWLGVLQARRRGSGLDRWLTRLSLAGYAMPSFWLGLILISFVSLRWHWLPAAQMRDPLLPPDAPILVRWFDVLRHLILPVLTLSVVTIAGTMRYQRTAMLQVMRMEYVRAARARGLSERRVIWRHAWRNAVFPVLTLFGLWLPILVTGSVFVESVFNWPGLGGLAAEAIGTRDYPLLMGTALLVSTLVVLGGMVTDLGYLLLDPRVRER
jgi:ABC-type dipeptide/oligopeptide/nickel transport system permease component